MSLVELAILVGSLALTFGAIYSPLMLSRSARAGYQVAAYVAACLLALAAYRFGQRLYVGGWSVAGEGLRGGALLTGCFLAVMPFTAAANRLAKIRRGPRPEGIGTVPSAEIPLRWLVLLAPAAALLVAAVAVSAGSLIWDGFWALLVLWRTAGGHASPALVNSLLVLSFAAGSGGVLYVAAGDWKRRRANPRGNIRT